MNLRIGARGSDLSLAQARLVIEALTKSSGTSSEIISIKTRGDKRQGTDAARISDKKEWVYELELAVLEGSVDFAVHSGKDVPVNIEPGTTLLPVLKRELPFDAFIGRVNGETGRRIKFEDVPKGGSVGTASLRRAAQVLRLRPDIKVIEHRGNVPTRIRKLDESKELDGIILACAGLLRLGIAEKEFSPFAANELLPAINQGILVAQFRSDSKEVRRCIESIIDPDTIACWSAERSCVEILGADCHSSVCIYATVIGPNEVELSVRVLSRDGSDMIEHSAKAARKDAVALGKQIAQQLLAYGAGKFL